MHAAMDKAQRGDTISMKAGLTVRTSKFGNEKTNGFDSKREARRYAELELLHKIGKISDLKCQVTFELLPRQKRDNGSTENPVSYRADFTYIDGGKLVVEDAKGHRTQDYIIKRKLMLAIHNITVKEV